MNGYRSRIDVVDSVIEGNTSQQSNTGGFGGGIAATSNFANQAGQQPAIVTLTRTLVRNNTSVGINGAQTGIAGGIAVLGDSFSTVKATLTVNDSVIDKNSAHSQGGGMLVTRANLTIANSLLIRNTVSNGAAPGGGGIRATENSNVTISGSTIANNTATGGPASMGGGIYLEDSNPADGRNVVNISGSNLYANSVTGNAISRGGAIFVGPNSQGTINNNKIADNTSTLAGQLREEPCQPLVTYPNNTFPSGSVHSSSDGECADDRITGETTANPRFAIFMAVPGSGISTTLAWSVARATGVTIAGVGTFNSPDSPTGTVDVTPTSSTTFSLTATASSPNGGNYSAVTAGFTYVQPTLPPLGTFTEGDVDGDGRTELSVYRPSNGTWFLQNIATGGQNSQQWGLNGDIPVSGDYDGDGRAIWRSTGRRPASGMSATRAPAALRSCSGA